MVYDQIYIPCRRATRRENLIGRRKLVRASHEVRSVSGCSFYSIRDGLGCWRLGIFRRQLQISHEKSHVHIREADTKFLVQPVLNVRERSALFDPSGNLLLLLVV